jgi:hypothetical protein
MNYKLKVLDDGTKVWSRLKYNEETKKIELEEVPGPIILNPDDYFETDEITINSNPPPSPENCVPFEELIKKLEEEIKNKPPKKFEPFVFYNRHWPGQAVEVYLESDAYYAKWVGPHLTTYHSLEDNRLVGLVVEGLIYLKTKQECD